MCESTVYLIRSGKKEAFMKEVARIDIGKDTFKCRDILGETRELKGAVLKEIDLVGHSIVFEARGGK